MAYVVLDAETGIQTKNRRKGSPWHPDNYVVAWGWKMQGDKQCSYEYFTSKGTNYLKIPKKATLLVGFNLKFDLLWMWDNPELKDFFKRGGRIWDCQYVEDMLERQNVNYHMCSLDETAPRYGGTTKVDEVKLLWNAGVDTKDINKDLLLDYLCGPIEEDGLRKGGDIGNTEKIFLGQMKRVLEMNMLQAIRSRMDGLCATTEMEYNGIKIDVQEALKQLTELKAEREETYKKLNTYIPELPDGLEFNWSSTNHKSCLIFGGTIKYVKKANYFDDKTGELARSTLTEEHYLLEGTTSTCRVSEATQRGSMELYDPTGTYPVQVTKGGKNKGEPKTKKVKVPGPLKERNTDFYFKFPGYVQRQPQWFVDRTDAAGFPLHSVNEEIISTLATWESVDFCKDLGRYTSLDKEITTYFIANGKDGKPSKGMLLCVDPDDHRIHHGLNHTSTVTSRLSSSNPNMQNLPRGDKSKVKKLFMSRFEDGVMLEADYSQLEVVVQGVLTKDTNLCADLRLGIDFHCKRVALLHNCTYEEAMERCKNEHYPEYLLWKSYRTKCKEFSFQRAYGAGAKAIALSTGMDEETVKTMIVNEEIQYPQVVKFYTQITKEIEESAKPFRDPSEEYKVFRRGYWTAPTGCLYSFRSYSAQDWQRERGIQESFSPTEIKNYPIQGTGGEIVQGISGRLWRHLVSNDNYNNRVLLVNTVHDCIWVDMGAEMVETVAPKIKEIMQGVDDWFQEFGITIDVPFPVEVEVGPNMYDLKHVA